MRKTPAEEIAHCGGYVVHYWVEKAGWVHPPLAQATVARVIVAQVTVAQVTVAQPVLAALPAGQNAVQSGTQDAGWVSRRVVPCVAGVHPDVCAIARSGYRLADSAQPDPTAHKRSCRSQIPTKTVSEYR